MIVSARKATQVPAHIARAATLDFMNTTAIATPRIALSTIITVQTTEIVFLIIILLSAIA